MVVKTLVLSGFLAGAVLLGSGCWCPSLQGSGVVKIEKRACSAEIQVLQVRNHARVTVLEGATPGLEVEGDDNIVPYIRTRVEGETLVVENAPELETGYSSRKGIHVRLTLPRPCLREALLSSHGRVKVPEMAGDKVVIGLSSHGDLSVERVKAGEVSMELSSHGNVEIGSLEGETLTLDMSSHGDVAIRDGRVKVQNVTLSSHGQYQAENLVSGTAEVHLSSHGDVLLHVTDLLRATVTSHGEIRYRGRPRVDVPEKQGKRVRPL